MMPEPGPSSIVPERDTGGDAAYAKELFAVYEGFSKDLRTWLVAYGIGGPILFVTHEPVWRAIGQSGFARPLALLFLGGVALQVILAALNKTIMWAAYYGETEVSFQATRRFRLATWLSRQFWIDFLVDLVSILAFGWATYLAFRAITSAG